jgi:hypothetical protein
MGKEETERTRKRENRKSVKRDLLRSERDLHKCQTRTTRDLERDLLRSERDLLRSQRDIERDPLRSKRDLLRSERALTTLA